MTSKTIVRNFGNAPARQFFEVPVGEIVAGQIPDTSRGTFTVPDDVSAFFTSPSATARPAGPVPATYYAECGVLVNRAELAAIGVT